MWELDCEEGWAPKNWYFWTVVLEKTLESPLDCKEIQPVNPKGNQSWIFIRRTGAPILWSPDVKSQFIRKDSDDGKDWRQEEKGTTEDEIVEWHQHHYECPSNQWCHPTISSSVGPFSSHLQSFPASGSFPMSWVFTSGGQNVVASALASVLPMNSQDWYPLGLTGQISLHSQEILKSPLQHDSSKALIRCSAFFIV